MDINYILGKQDEMWHIGYEDSAQTFEVRIVLTKESTKQDKHLMVTVLLNTGEDCYLVYPTHLEGILKEVGEKWITVAVASQLIGKDVNGIIDLLLDKYVQLNKMFILEFNDE